MKFMKFTALKKVILCINLKDYMYTTIILKDIITIMLKCKLSATRTIHNLHLVVSTIVIIALSGVPTTTPLGEVSVGQ